MSKTCPCSYNRTLPCLGEEHNLCQRYGCQRGLEPKKATAPAIPAPAIPAPAIPAPAAPATAAAAAAPGRVLPLAVFDGGDWSYDTRTDTVRIGRTTAARRDWIEALERLASPFWLGGIAAEPGRKPDPCPTRGQGGDGCRVGPRGDAVVCTDCGWPIEASPTGGR
jgi:hypothetical protein